ncbi:putative aspartic peptidase domain superfamily, DNA/RNA polymerase superfamily [Helianthus annuus]|nr:putative aspartic peptidase domain superfamily, DNA/RNA polymerase superfamily [Helianthus annuus]KAJ0627675.1 putative aspartic peptidase domain superfamily, DNA/RNA polymerase superfamily [Helianthus annuus]KAJ0783974.1 putative aspartic peptidase domain superfamily, DNA/RNA polymerase superfamily [Helianthus annuus]
MDQYSRGYNYTYNEDGYRGNYCTNCRNARSVQYNNSYQPSNSYNYYEEPRYEPSTSYTSYEDQRYEPPSSYSYFDEPRYEPSYSYFEDSRYEPPPSYSYYEEPWREQPTSYEYYEEQSFDPYPSYTYNEEQWCEPSTSYEYYEELRIEQPDSSFEDPNSFSLTEVTNRILEHIKTIERYMKESRAREEESRAREELNCNNNVEIVENVKMEEQESEKPTHELNKEKGEYDNVKLQEESNFEEINLLSPTFENHCLVTPHAKFLKELNTSAKIKEVVSVKLTNDQTSLIKEDPFEINITPVPCFFQNSFISNITIGKDLCVNIMPNYIFEKLSNSDFTPLQIPIFLSDRKVIRSIGVVEDVLVQTNQMVIPTDFVILDDAPLVLGKPFVQTHKALKNRKFNNLPLQLGAFKRSIDLERSMKYPFGNNDPLIEDEAEPPDTTKEDDHFVEEEIAIEQTFKVLDLDEPQNKVSSKDPPIELKELPKGLEYAFLDKDGGLPVIISSTSSNIEKEKLVNLFKKHKNAIAWKLVDIKGISPSMCTHKILMNDDYKTVIQPQRRVNPNVQEVVKNEVIKLLDAGLIYPISDSPWVSPVQVVQKKEV